MKTNIKELIDELRRFADNEVHPIVSPDHWDVYSQLVDFIDELNESLLQPLKEQEAVTIKKIKDHGFGVYGGICPKCKNWIQSPHSYCGFCGQKVKWDV